jgi:hypothetical protein
MLEVKQDEIAPISFLESLNPSPFPIDLAVVKVYELPELCSFLEVTNELLRNLEGRFDDRQAALVSLVLTAAFMFFGSWQRITLENRSVPFFPKV